jgi:hypothetical protein
MTLNEKDPYAAYRDAQGAPQFALSYMLFFDILGTSEMSRAHNAIDHLRGLRPALEAAIERAGTDERVFGQASTWFTDNAVVATPLGERQFAEGITVGLQVAAAYLLLGCWERGYLGRGAITVGEHYMDERFVFGPALIEAVEREKAARWPRVTLSSDALLLERSHSGAYAQRLQSVQSRCLTLDEDGVVFIDHLGVYIDEEDNFESLEHFLGRHKAASEEGLRVNDADSAAWEKWRWLAEYQNHALASRLDDPERFMVSLDGQRHRFTDFLDEGPYTPPTSPWYAMDRADRLECRPSIDDFFHFLPDDPGVYALYLNEERMYVSPAKVLSGRARAEHRFTDRAAGRSELRCRLAEHLGVASAEDVRDERVTLDSSAAEKIRGWLGSCEIGYTPTTSEAEARRLAEALEESFQPPLNRIR